MKLFSREQYKISHLSRAACDPVVLEKILLKIDELELFEKVSLLPCFEYAVEKSDLQIREMFPVKEIYDFNLSKSSEDGKYVNLQVYPVTNAGSACMNLFAMIEFERKEQR